MRSGSISRARSSSPTCHAALSTTAVLMVIGTSGHSDPRDAVARLRANAAATLSLAPLTADAVAHLFEAEGIPTTESRATIRRLTGGLPVVVVEVVRALRGAGGVTTADGSELVLDVSLRSVPARLDRLGDSERATVQVASLLGAVEASMLSVVLGVSTHDVERAAEAARALAILDVDGSGFVHAHVRRAVHETVPRELAMRWHGALADELLRRRIRLEDACAALRRTSAWRAPRPTPRPCSARDGAP